MTIWNRPLSVLIAFLCLRTGPGAEQRDASLVFLAARLRSLRAVERAISLPLDCSQMKQDLSSSYHLRPAQTKKGRATATPQLSRDVAGQCFSEALPNGLNFHPAAFCPDPAFR